uniref:Uncharacterized protein n=1 Tax=Strigamia maritima TaxID=126957 RepID=T1J8I6_STRMM
MWNTESYHKDNTPTSWSMQASRWLNANYDPVSTLYTFSQCLELSDLKGDGDFSLVIADLGTASINMKLKVFKGVKLINENTLIDLPSGVVSFHMDTCEPRVSAIAVGGGSHIYIYKNLRPYFKFTLPTLDVNPMEQDIWMQAKAEKIDISMLRELLEGVRSEIGESSLTARSQRFLMLEADEMEQFANLHKSHPLKRQTVLTCLSTLKKSMSEDDAVSCLVLGTENKSIYILDPEAFTILTSMIVPSVPVFLTVSGLFDVEFKIIVACRNGCLYTLKRAAKQARLCIELCSQPVGLEKVGKNIVVGCMNDSLRCYTIKGKKQWQLQLGKTIKSMCSVEVKQLGITLIAVALSDGLIHFYLDRFLVDVMVAEDTVVALKFGRFGREDNTLVMVTQSGGLIVKILRRTAQFEAKDQVMGPPAAQNQKLNIPKKTKLFVDQAMRERENPVMMHRMFQQDLYRMRLEVAKCYVKSLQSNEIPLANDPEDPIKLTAQVHGLGPVFGLKIFLQNTSASKLCMNLALTFQYDDRIYLINKNYIEVSVLVPGLEYCFETEVRCVTDLALADKIKVFLIKPDVNTTPVVTASINMPVSETASF